MKTYKKTETISFKEALGGILSLSTAQQKKCEKAGVKTVVYSVWAGEPGPSLLDEHGLPVFNYRNGRLTEASL